jgi:peptidoglycan/xylan/chitin deacetylase (PgdA/CDA1 family)
VNDVIVLAYHAVSANWPADLAVRPEQLHDQLDLLVRRGYRGTTFHDAVTLPARGKKVAVTFDDAYNSVLELADPILSSLGLIGTVFVVTDFADGEGPLCWPGIDHWLAGPHHSELRGLSWSQLAGLADAGWEIGSHTLSHPRLTRLDDDALKRELRGSREACEHALRLPCRSLAYPYGDVDRRAARAAGDAGYAAAGTLPARLDGATRLTWPRIGIYRGDSLRRFRLKASPPLRRLRESAGPAEELVRSDAVRSARSASARIFPFLGSDGG